MMNNNYIYEAKIIKVYNSTSFNLIIDLGFNVFILKDVNLFGVKSHEIDHKELENLRKVLINKQVLIKSIKNKEEYLVEIVGNFGGQNVNLASFLISLGLVQSNH